MEALMHRPLFSVIRPIKTTEMNQVAVDQIITVDFRAKQVAMDRMKRIVVAVTRMFLAKKYRTV